MHLVLCHPADLCARAVAAGLRANGHAVRVMTSPLGPPARLVLEIDRNGQPVASSASLALDDGPAGQIESVFLRANGIVDMAGWDPRDHAYMQSETSAALLAWLEALDCPVINRPTAELWYRHWNPPPYWVPHLHRCGLPTPDMTITSDPQEAQAFRRALEADGIPGAICTSLTREEAWLVTPGDWPGVAELQRHAPVCLVEPHRDAHPACIVGGTVIWNAATGPVAPAFERQMAGFAARMGLDFLEIAVARARKGWVITDVNLLPRFEHFGQSARRRIVERLVALLCGGRSALPELAEVSG